MSGRSHWTDYRLRMHLKRIDADRALCGEYDGFGRRNVQFVYERSRANCKKCIQRVQKTLKFRGEQIRRRYEWIEIDKSTIPPRSLATLPKNNIGNGRMRFTEDNRRKKGTGGTG